MANPPSSLSKWFWSAQSALLFLLLVLPFCYGYSVFGRFRGAVPARAAIAHAVVFLVGVRALMEQPHKKKKEPSQQSQQPASCGC